jgi:L-lysine 2,3-aminomutase
VLFTGGDPMVMRASVLRRYIEPLLDLRLPHLAAIRIGTKSLSYWPMRFTTDRDADDLLRLFEDVVARGLSLALMAHFSHPRELETPEVQAAIRRIRSTGAVIRTQAPLVRHVNDDPLVWSEMWRLQVRLGMVPYYMFVERDTGPRAWFEVPLVRAAEIFREATARVGGLARTVRGPSMSATPGKVVIDGVARVAGEDVFVLRFLQARDPDWVGRPFFARLDPEAAWFDQLRPASGEPDFFFERAYHDHARASGGGPWAPALTRRHLPVWTDT